MSREIKANELRLGNLINDESTTHIVTSIDEFCVNSYWIKDKERECLYKTPLHLLKPIPLTEEWLLKFGFEDWGNGNLYANEFESYKRYVLHNALDGTSNFEVHKVISIYGGETHIQFIISCDEDDRLNWGIEIKHLHQLQNLYFSLTGEELLTN